VSHRALEHHVIQVARSDPDRGDTDGVVTASAELSLKKCHQGFSRLLSYFKFVSESPSSSGCPVQQL
jgi:hypothetical protein